MKSPSSLPSAAAETARGFAAAAEPAWVCATAAKPGRGAGGAVRPKHFSKSVAVLRGASGANCPGTRAWVSQESLSVDELIAFVRGPTFGAVVTMQGMVRDMEDGRGIASIAYEAYLAMAERELLKAVREAERRWRVCAAARHRVGRVPVGEPAVIVAAAGAHRPEAFAACRFLIDEIKAKAPIWKVRFEWVDR